MLCEFAWLCAELVLRVAADGATRDIPEQTGQQQADEWPLLLTLLVQF